MSIDDDRRMGGWRVWSGGGGYRGYRRLRKSGLRKRKRSRSGSGEKEVEFVVKILIENGVPDDPEILQRGRVGKSRN
ncbi:hypothetical protein Droror1_Dr00024715 [Drosera rotundifolia]